MGVVAEPGFQIPARMRRRAAESALGHLSIATEAIKSLSVSILQHNQSVITVSAIFFLLCTCFPLHGREHKRKVTPEDYRAVFSTEISSPESEVSQAVEAIVNNGIIQGSKEYNKDKYIENASAATSSSLFPVWKEPGTVYYKVRTGVLAPLNFKDSRDEGTLAVRYIVQSKDASKSILRIDAVFVEDFRHTVHPSDGSVENAECKEIQDQIDAIEAEKKQGQERQQQGGDGREVPAKRGS